MHDISRAERAELQAAVRGFFDRYGGEAEVRARLGDERGYDRDVWTRLSEQLGLPGLLIPESFGGQGFSPQEAVLGLEEAGRQLSGVPLLSSTVMAPWALLAADDAPAAGPLLNALADGTAIAALAFEAADGGIPVAASLDGPGRGWRLDGVLTNVLGAHVADTLLVVSLVPGPGEADSELGLFAVPAYADRVKIEVLPSLDLTRPLSRVTLGGAQGTRIGGDFAAGLTSCVHLATVGACAELLGVAEQCLSIAVEYAKTREQFGVRIGTFQAVKHLLADTLAAVEQMRAAVATAAAAFVEAPDEVAELTSVVKAYCSDAGPRAVEGLIQTLGGIGFTWEHVAHLYLRRAKTLEVLFGDAAFHRARLGARLGLSA